MKAIKNPPKQKVIKGLQQAVKEMNLVKAEKLKAGDARGLIKELRPPFYFFRKISGKFLSLSFRCRS